jgi:SOS-response transcriptional repressor LexA
MIAIRIPKGHNGPMKLALGPLLKKVGMSQTALADAIGVNKSFISDIVAGKKRPSLATLHKIVAVLEVSPAALYDADDLPEETVSQGFSESEAVPFSPARVNDMASLLRAVAPDVRRPEVFQARKSCTGFGIMKGDALIVDMQGQATDGDVVLATFVDDAGVAATLLRRWVAPWLISDDPADPPLRLDPASQMVAILGAVRGSLRGAGVASS